MTGHLRIPEHLAEEIVAHCESGRPNEACGMVGIVGGEVVKVFKMTNAAASPVRYSLEPREQLAVENTLAEKGWDGAPFHSHTRTEAYPSPTDVRLAVGDNPYVIVSLANDPPDIRAFLIKKENWEDDTGAIEEVPVDITG